MQSKFFLGLFRMSLNNRNFYCNLFTIRQYQLRFMSTPVLVIHGGAGPIEDALVSGTFQGLKKSLRCAWEILSPTNKEACPGSALDAVEAAVRSMEEDCNFNAGFGACLNSEGNIEVEACIMDGSNLKCGCVTLLHDIMHPISVARRVMEKTPHNFLGGTSAQKFAIAQGFEQLPPGSLITEHAKTALQTHKQDQLKSKTANCNSRTSETVGAVAMDCKGNIAAATSTGGLTGKMPGRIGDVPILGCGTYADNCFGGVSTTGHGETIMRYNLSQRILENIRSQKMDAQEATEIACADMTKRLTETAGAIAIDFKGKIGIYWTSSGMAWGCIRSGKLVLGIDHGKEETDNIIP